MKGDFKIMKVIVGSRGSKLALTQTNWVIDKIKNANPHVEVELKVIKTKGDKIQNVALDKIGDKGIFVKEIEQELLEGKIDIAIHSMKDMPSIVPEGLKFSYVPEREDFRDVIILKEGYNSLKDLPQGAKIGTGSKRRKYQLLKYRPDLDIIPIRGNIDTRIRKIEEENLHGVVLAAAGINRLGMENKINNKVFYVDEDIILPAPAQGILAIEIRENDHRIEELLKPIHHEESKIQAEAERGFLEAIDGSCHIPVGALCTVNEEEISIDGLFGLEDGSVMVRKTVKGRKEEARRLGFKLAEEIREEMGKVER